MIIKQLCKTDYIPTTRWIRLSLLITSLLLNYLMWCVVDTSYLTFWISGEGWTGSGRIVLHIKDLLISLSVGIFLVYFTFIYTEKVSYTTIDSHPVLSLLGKHLLLLFLNGVLSFILTIFIDKIVPWQRTMPLNYGFLVYTVTSTFCSGIYLSIRYNMNISLARKTEAELVLKQMESEKLLLSERLAKTGMQVDNHFMLNSLSALNIMIDIDPDNASLFCQSLTECYKYLVGSMKKQLVPVEEEIQFLHRYFTMMNYRFPDCFCVTIDITITDGEIPPLSMQGLVENALKHNAFSPKSPLIISIYNEGNYICIRNNISPIISPVPTTGVGLKLIRDRYIAFGQNIVVTETPEFYTVSLPLINITQIYENSNN